MASGLVMVSGFLVSPASGLVFTHTQDSGAEKEFKEFFNHPLPMVA